MNAFLDIAGEQIHKAGEELCGDSYKAVRLPDRSLVVLADGLGSGVKANILATLTTEIVTAMSRMDRPLHEILTTLAGTLPLAGETGTSYSTFTIVEVRHRDGTFHILNYGNPSPFYARQGRPAALEIRTEDVLGKRVEFASGCLLPGDALGLLTDGLPSTDVETSFTGLQTRFPSTARGVVHEVMRRARGRAAQHDATFVGLYLRTRRAVIVFTGPPRDPADDKLCLRRFAEFDGAKVICGGTTATLFADYVGAPIHTDHSTERERIPPIAEIRGADLVTEGIYTLAGAIEQMKACGGDPFRLPGDRNGAVLLATELLRADMVYFLVGQAVNPAYQNPLLPKNISIRRSLVDELAGFLRGINKEVEVECR